MADVSLPPAVTFLKRCSTLFCASSAVFLKQSRRQPPDHGRGGGVGGLPRVTVSPLCSTPWLIFCRLCVHCADTSLFVCLCFQDADAVCNLILSLVYYFCNLMPLSRGSRYTGCCCGLRLGPSVRVSVLSPRLSSVGPGGRVAEITRGGNATNALLLLHRSCRSILFSFF